MLRMFRELKGSYRYIVLILHCCSDRHSVIWRCHRTLRILSMWVYSRVVFRDSVPDQIRENSMDQLFLFMDSDQQQEVKEYYTLKDGVYTHKKLKEEEREFSEYYIRKVDAGSKQSAAARYTECSGREDAASGRCGCAGDNRTASGRGEKTDNGTNDRKNWMVCRNLS